MLKMLFSSSSGLHDRNESKSSSNSKKRDDSLGKYVDFEEVDDD